VLQFSAGKIVGHITADTLAIYPAN